MRRELASSQPFMHAGHSCGSAVRGAFAAQVGRIPLPTSSSLYTLMLSHAGGRWLLEVAASPVFALASAACPGLRAHNLRAHTMCVRQKGDKRASIRGVIAIIITIIIIIIAYPFSQVLCSCVLSAAAYHAYRWLRAAAR